VRLYTPRSPPIPRGLGHNRFDDLGEAPRLVFKDDDERAAVPGRYGEPAGRSFWMSVSPFLSITFCLVTLR
jgi:hypothetical protein